MRRALLVAVLCLAACATVDRDQYALGEPAAVCDTDADCAAFCPPPADEPDCDGGPQS